LLTKAIRQMQVLAEKEQIWVVVGAAAAIFFPGSLVFGLPGLMSPLWGQSLGVSAGALSYVMFFLLAALGIFMFVVGKWTDRLGAKSLIMIGTVLAALAAALTGVVTNVWMIYGWAFLIGTATCFIYSPGIGIVQKCFPHIKGTVSGIVNLTFGISSALLVPLYRLWLDTLGHVTLGIAISATTLIIGLVAAQLIAEPRPAAGSRAPLATANNAVNLSITMTPAEAVRTKNFWLLWVVWSLMGAAGITMVTQSVRYGLYLGLGLAGASSILAAFNLTNGLSRIISGAVSDLIGRKLTLAFSFVAAGLAYLLLAQSTSLGLILVLAAIIGFGYGTLFACSAPLIAECFGLKHFGVIFGLVFTSFGFVSGLLGPVATGLILQATQNSYAAAYSFLGLLCLVSAALIVFVKQPERAKSGAAPTLLT